MKRHQQTGANGGAAAKEYKAVSDVPRVHTDYCPYCDEDVEYGHKPDCKFRLTSEALAALLDDEAGHKKEG